MDGEGYRPEETIITLEFDDADLKGLKVVTRSVRLEKFLEMMRDSLDAARTAQLIQDFGEKALIDWNLLDPETGKPVPATFDGMKTQDTNLMVRIVRAWTASVGSAPAPLDDESSSGTSTATGGNGSAPAIPMTVY